MAATAGHPDVAGERRRAHSPHETGRLVASFLAVFKRFEAGKKDKEALRLCPSARSCGAFPFKVASSLGATEWTVLVNPTPDHRCREFR